MSFVYYIYDMYSAVVGHTIHEFRSKPQTKTLNPSANLQILISKLVFLKTAFYLILVEINCVCMCVYVFVCVLGLGGEGDCCCL